MEWLRFFECSILNNQVFNLDGILKGVPVLSVQVKRWKSLKLKGVGPHLRD